MQSGLTLLQQLGKAYTEQPRQENIMKIIADKNDRYQNISLSIAGAGNAIATPIQWVAVRVEQAASIFFSAAYLCKHVASTLVKLTDALSVGDLHGVKEAASNGGFKLALDVYTAVMNLFSIAAPETVYKWNLPSNGTDSDGQSVVETSNGQPTVDLFENPVDAK